MSSFFSKFNDLNVLIIGDVMIDRYINGHVSRISPEAPVPVLEWRDTDNRLGGAANVALNIKSLGANPILFGVIGDNEDGEIFKNLLDNANIDNQYIVTEENRPTTVKTRMMASGQQLLRLDQETTVDINENTSNLILNKIRQYLDNQRIDVLIFQDYNKGLLTEELIKTVIRISHKYNIPTCVDPKKKNFGAYKEVTLFKPNLKEIREAMNQTVNVTKENLEKAADFIHSKLNNKIVFITLSENGVFVEQNEKGDIYPTQPRTIADVCGAGDSVISVIALALALKLPNEKLALLANLAGGLVCEEVGVVPINKEKLEKEYEIWSK